MPGFQRNDGATVSGHGQEERYVVFRMSPQGRTMTGCTRIMAGSIGAIVAAGLLAGALLVASGSPAPAAPTLSQAARVQSAAESSQRAVTVRSGRSGATPVPAGLQPPAGNMPEVQFAARGVREYQCTAGAWVFLEPAPSWLVMKPGRQASRPPFTARGRRGSQ